MARGGRTKPPLRRIHDDLTYERDPRARRSLAYHRSRTTEELVASLLQEDDEPLRVKPDGRIFQGNTRVKVLQERGYPVDELPRFPVIEMSNTEKRNTKRALRGASIQFADGRVVAPEPLDVEQILTDFERLGDRDRSAFLCVLAHNLTVEIRALLFDRPVSERNLDRAYQINESLHQLTSCVNPRHRRSAASETDLVRAVIESSYLYGLEGAVGRAIATAAGNSIAPATEHAAAID